MCYILDRRGHRVKREGKLCEVAHDIVAESDGQAKEILQRVGFEFIRWW